MSQSVNRQLSLGVVIPCHNNSWQLQAIIECLQYQTVKPEAVVVVDDNSGRYEAKRIMSLCRSYNASYERLPDPKSFMERLGRRSQARNLGTKCLKTEIVLYLDGDMMIGHRYIEEIKHHHLAMPVVYIRGQRYSICAAQQDKGIEYCVNEVLESRTPRKELFASYTKIPASFTRRRAKGNAYYDKWEWCASNNISVRRSYVSQIGYWDENFLGWGEEDMDFSYRLFQLGLIPVVLISKDSASYHLEHKIEHDTNRFTLEKNARYFVNKFPQVIECRKEAYQEHGVDLELPAMKIAYSSHSRA